MAIRPCPNVIDCPNTEFPLGNFSSEAPDPNSFTGLFFPFLSANNPIGGIGGGNFPPPFYFADGCMSVCLSEISQEDANLCAQRAAYICSHTPPAPQTAPAFFYSNLQVCNFSCPDGSVFSYRVLPGSFVATSQAEADQQAAAYACNQGAIHLICLSDIPNGCLNSPYSATVTPAARGNPPFVFSITAGALPPGITMEQVSSVAAVLSGTPTVPGNSVFVLRLTDSNGNFMERTYTLAVLGISNTPPSATQGTAYTFQFAAAGGTPPYTFALGSGALPAGLTLASDGTISGTPTTTQTASFTVTVTDSSA